MKITGRHIAAAREVLGITQADLAALAEVSITAIYKFEKGLRTPRPATINALQLALESRGIEFLNGDGIGVRLRPGKPATPGVVTS